MADSGTVSIFLTVIASLASLFSGAFLTEWIRRRNRIENLASVIFEKKVYACEGLYALVKQSREVLSECHKSKVSGEDVFEIENAIVWSFVEYCEEHELYISENLRIQAMTLFMDCQNCMNRDLHELGPEMKSYDDYSSDILNTLNMIRGELGVGRVEKLLQNISGAEYNSAVLSYFCELKDNKEREKVDPPQSINRIKELGIRMLEWMLYKIKSIK
jgi:hypothetical protein